MAYSSEKLASQVLLGKKGMFGGTKLRDPRERLVQALPLTRHPCSSARNTGGNVHNRSGVWRLQNAIPRCA
jgi:hypothetical protein